MLASSFLGHPPAAASSLIPIRLPSIPFSFPLLSLPPHPRRVGIRLGRSSGRGPPPSASATSSYEVGGAYPDEEVDFQDQFGKEGDKKLDASQYEALLKGGEQVASVLQEMITLLEDMNMDEASEKVAVELAAQGVIGKRVDEMESGFMMALDYMIQLAEKDQDEEVFVANYFGHSWRY